MADNTKNHDLDLRKKLEFVEGKIIKMINGESLELKKNEDGKVHPNDKWFVDQLEVSRNAEYLVNAPRHYYHLEGEEPIGSVTGKNPLISISRSNHRRTIKRLEEDAKDIWFPASKLINKSDDYELNIPEHKKGFIVPRGDMYAAHAMVNIIKEKVIALEEGRTDDPIIQKPLVITNSSSNEDKFKGQYWDNLFHGIGLDTLDEKSKKDLNIHVADTREKTAAIMRKELPRELEVPPPPKKKDPLEANTNLFAATTTIRKYFEFVDHSRGKALWVRQMSQLGVVVHSPDETSKTLEGNALEKSNFAQIGAAHVTNNSLARMGIKRSQAETLVDDTGTYPVDQRVFDHFDFSGTEHLKDWEQWKKDSRPIPGEEIGPFMNASGGKGEFARRMISAFDKLEKAVKIHNSSGKQPPMKPVDRTIIEESVIIVKDFPDFDPSIKTIDDLPKGGMEHVILGKQKFILAKNIPEDIPEKEFELYHVELPVGQKKGEEKTRQDFIDEGIFEYEPRKKALDTWYTMNGGDLLDLDQKKAQRHDSGFTISLSFAEGQKTNGKHNDLKSKLNKSGIYFTEDRKQRRNFDDVKKNFLDDNDMIVIMPDPEEMTLKDTIFKLSKVYSIIVDKQTNPDAALKPIVFYNPDGSHDKLVDDYETMMAFGGAKEEFNLMAEVVTTPEEILKIAEKARKNQYPPVEKQHFEYEEPPIVDTGKFNVAVFSSAGFKGEQMEEMAFDVAYNLQQNDMAIFYGGMGRDMGVMHYEGTAAAKLDGIDAFIGGSNMPYLEFKEGEHPEGLDHFYEAPNIFKRMEYMVNNSDAFIIEPGGPGTMEEFNHVLAMKLLEPEKHADKEMIVINEAVERTDDNGRKYKTNYYDEVIKDNFSEQELDDLGVTFVSNRRQAIDEAHELKKTSQKENIRNDTEIKPYKEKWKEVYAADLNRGNKEEKGR